VHLFAAVVGWVQRRHDTRLVVDGRGFEPRHSERRPIIVRGDPRAALPAWLESLVNQELDRYAFAIEPLTLQALQVAMEAGGLHRLVE